MCALLVPYASNCHVLEYQISIPHSIGIVCGLLPDVPASRYTDKHLAVLKTPPIVNMCTTTSRHP